MMNFPTMMGSMAGLVALAAKFLLQRPPHLSRVQKRRRARERAKKRRFRTRLKDVGIARVYCRMSQLAREKLDYDLNRDDPASIEELDRRTSEAGLIWVARGGEISLERENPEKAP